MSDLDSDYRRKPAWAGAFYDNDPQRLDRIVTEYLNKAPAVDVQGEIVGIVSPHAGYDYSGPTAATAYKLVIGKTYDSVIIIAPSHREYIEGISVFPGKTYETPLGVVPVDQELANEIAAKGTYIHLSMSGHRSPGDDSEHSLEVQLPFLQKAITTGLQIVPIVFHDYSFENCKELGEEIYKACGDRHVLIVASSDLYHGYSYDACRSTDERTLAAIEKFDAKNFASGLNNGTYQACGGGPIVSLMIAAQKMGANHVKIVAQTNSADVIGRSGGWVVGYAAVAVSKGAD